jgi:hypothetical protein
LNLRPVWLTGIKIIPAGNTNYLTDKIGPHVRFIFFLNPSILSRPWQIDRGDEGFEVLRCAACRPSEKCGENGPLAPVASSASSIDARCSTSPTAGARRRRSQRGGAGRASPAGARRRRSSTCPPHSAAAQDALPRPELAGEHLQRGGEGRYEATFFALIILVKVPLLFKITSPSQWLGSLVIYSRVIGSKPGAQIFSFF